MLKIISLNERVEEEAATSSDILHFFVVYGNHIYLSILQPVHVSFEDICESQEVVIIVRPSPSLKQALNCMFVPQAGLSEDILARLIDVSSRTTSRSTTVSESVMSALSSIRPGDEMIHEEEKPPALAILDGNVDTRSESRQGSHRSSVTPDDQNDTARANSRQSVNSVDFNGSRQQGSRSRGELNSRSSTRDSNRDKEHGNRPKSRN